ncbi:sulfur carrier protein ThiS [Saccharomonospora azurea]|uniref:Thiamine biosynthesis protein ThiS n=1 Tax=Saccharomonospora azurea NA-128 TaxID=882081 RepID=H8G4N8_9PSEU|nr:sulfur carrier protein ThiS [Saccharomonospora azurea]EHK87395.1 sulfur carrier protein ThiS [Saccharomonospora azurea SZMC 14600]EHY89141.1 thiamine biosynthesis protein ThiS [Saccharomonospora azurea NA-128]
MRVLVNGENHELPEGSTVADVLDTAVENSTGVAVAVNGEVVRRGDWADVVVGDGAVVEVLTAVQGG